MDVEMTRSAETNVLKLKGSWTIERANELKCVLLEILNGCERIVIEPEGLTELDLSTVQLFCSAHRTSLRLGKRFVIHEQKSEAFKRLARDAGLLRSLGCHKDPRESCLWTGGWES
jgi:anti-anti-sigma regulatory factor